MYEGAKQTWVDFIESFKEMRLLWDPAHEHNTNKYFRNQAYEKLLPKFKKIDEHATLGDMKNKILNMRTAFNRERKKVRQSIENGDKEIYSPTLWYFDLFSSFLDSEGISNFNTIQHFGNTQAIHQQLKRTESSTPSRRSSRRLNGSTKEEEETEKTQPTPAKRRIFNLLHKQEQFIDTASQKLVQKEEEWEIHGKAIGLQLHRLKDSQRNIAQKLISDVIFFGNLGTLTVDSFINVNNRRDSPEIHEQIDYLEEELSSCNEDE